MEELETNIYKDKENLIKVTKDKQRLEASLKLKGLSIEKMTMNQGDVNIQ